MKTRTVAVFVMIAAVFSGAEERPPGNLLKKLATVIRKHCPDAKIEVTGNEFSAKSGTMMFTLHRQQMNGEFLSRSDQEEGPNFKGFVLIVTVMKGVYQGGLNVNFCTFHPERC